MLNRTWRVVLAVLLPAVAQTLAPCTAWSQPSQLTIGTNQVGTAYFTTGSAIAKVLAGKLSVPLRVQPQSGSSVAIPLVNSGDLQLVIHSGNEGRLAYNSIRPFLPAPKLRLLSILYPFMGSMSVRNDSGITSIDQLKGKRVSGEFRGQLDVQYLTTAALASHGLSLKDVTIVPASNVNVGSQGLIEKRIDSTFFAPSPRLREVNSLVPGGLRFLTVDASPAGLARMRKVMPDAYVVPLKAGATTAVVTDVDLLAWDVYFSASTALDANTAYEIVKALYRTESDLKASYVLLRGFARAKMAKSNVTVPYHEGAVRAYKELGLWTGANDAQQAALLKR